MEIPHYKNYKLLKSLRYLIFKHIIIPLGGVYLRVITRPCVRALILNENKSEVLLIKNIAHDEWSLCGGGMNRGEIPEHALLREIYEELGMKIKNIEAKLGEYVDIENNRRGTIYVFVCTTSSRDVILQWELDDARWFPIDQLPADIARYALRRIVEYREGKRDVVGEW